MLRYTKDYYVTVVVKNRDYLIGFLDAVSAISEEMEVDFTALDSMRLTDVLPSGKRRRDLTPLEIMEDLATTIEGTVVESDNVAYEEQPYFEVHCDCGNYIRFNSPHELPTVTRKCEICNKVMIDYTGHDQDDYYYDGVEEKRLFGIDEETDIIFLESLIDEKDDEDDSEEDDDDYEPEDPNLDSGF
jgi:hypothetical protein